MAWYLRVKQLVHKYPNRSLLLFYLAVGLIASYLFFLRFPNNFMEPNFYAEDGSVYLHNIEKNGFFHALFTTFNGYFISGLYLIEGVGYGINALFFHGSFVNIPRSFAVASYLFLGFVSALPVLLFRRYIKLTALLLAVALSIFIPLPGYDYAIIGTIGNLKFIFVYIAFLLIIYRNILSPTSWQKFIIVDILLLVCAYTNVVVYALLPFVLIRYRSLLRFDRKKIKKLIHERSFQSLLALGILLIPQIVVIKLFGIPSIPGYLDTPYQIDATVNTFIYRSYLYPLLPGLMSHMNDFLVIVAFVVLNTLLWFGLRRYRFIYLFGMVAIFLITLLFVMNRTGVSELFKTYLSSGPDQFFYTQNIIICFLVSIAVVELIRQISNRKIQLLAYIFIGLSFVFLYAPTAGSYGKNDFMQRTVGNIYLNAQSECKRHTGTPDLQLYPVMSDAFPLKDIARDRICTSEVAAYVPDTEYPPFDSLAGTYIADIDPAKPSQTLKANYNGLSGVSIMFLTYKQVIKDTYVATIYEKNCQTKLRTATISPLLIKDTSYARINFTRIPNSKDKIYCLKLASESPKTAALAVALSKPDAYPTGTLNTNNADRADDILFRLHYSK